MRNTGQLFFGVFLILFGGLILVSNLLGINFWAVCWPTGLMFLGLWVILRPRMLPEGTDFDYRFIGDIRREGTWAVTDEEMWMLIGDAKLDLTQAEIPTGETRLRVSGFIGDVKLTLPAEVGLRIDAFGAVNQIKIDGDKQEHIFTPLDYESENYASAERQVHLEANFFVNEIKVTTSQA